MSSAAEVQIPGVSANLLYSVAHELRQPLGTIESIAYYLAMVLPRGDEKIQAQVARLQQLVEQSNWILTSGMHLADTTPSTSATVDVGELVTQVIAMAGSENGPVLDLHLEASLHLICVEPGRMRHLLENLLTLFSHLADGVHPVCLSITAAGEPGVLLDWSTSAPGFQSEGQLGCGSALSIESARRTVAAHGGSFDLAVSPVNGVRLRVMLP